MSMTQHQQEVFNAITTDIKENLFSFYKSDDLESHLLSLTGAAGTGKSFLTAQITKEIIKGLIEFNYYHNDGVCLTAPTHKAVNVLKEMLSEHKIDADCRTIHSFLNIKPIHDYDTGEERFIVIRNRQSAPKASLLIVDESSMVSRELYGFILDAIIMGRVNTVLFIGDQYQLLPVNSGENSIFKLKKQYQLTQIVRQAEDSDIIKLATKVRKCIEEQEFVSLKSLFTGNYGEDVSFFKSRKLFVEDFYKNEQWYKEDKIMTSYTNEQVDSFNMEIRNQFWKERGVFNPNYFLPNDMIRFKSALNIQRLSRVNNPTLYHNGEEVMIDKVEFVKHHSGLEFWKCTVVGREERDFFRVIDHNSILLFNKFLQRYVDLAKSVRKPFHREYWKYYFQLKNAFAEVQYIYASTIHKLQGSTYDTAYIDLASLVDSKHLSNDLKFRLAYVAITRARKSIKVLY